MQRTTKTPTSTHQRGRQRRRLLLKVTHGFHHALWRAGAAARVWAKLYSLSERKRVRQIVTGERIHVLRLTRIYDVRQRGARIETDDELTQRNDGDRSTRGLCRRRQPSLMRETKVRTRIKTKTMRRRPEMRRQSLRSLRRQCASTTLSPSTARRDAARGRCRIHKLRSPPRRPTRAQRSAAALRRR